MPPIPPIPLMDGDGISKSGSLTSEMVASVVRRSDDTEVALRSATRATFSGQ